MSTRAEPGSEFTAVLEDAPAGLTGLAFSVRTTPGRVAVAVTGSGVTEHVAGDSTHYYTATRLLPNDLAATDYVAGTGYEVVWTHSSLAQPLLEELVVVYAPVYAGDAIPTIDDVAAILHARLPPRTGGTRLSR
jgi:hypothetical protein